MTQRTVALWLAMLGTAVAFTACGSSDDDSGPEAIAGAGGVGGDGMMVPTGGSAPPGTGGTPGMVGEAGAAGGSAGTGGVAALPPECAGVDLAIGQQVGWPTNDWTVKKPEDMGMDSKVLEEAFDYAFRPEQNTQGVVIIRGGALVAERYATGAGPDSWAASWSMGKSFVSALVGIAMDEGLIANVEVPMSTFFPEWKGTPYDPITLQSVLWMQSGLDFLEDYQAAALFTSDIIAMGGAADALMVAKSQPVRAAPNTRWYYSSGDSMLLGAVVQSATGMTPTDYAMEKLFGPIGMNPVQWWLDGANHTLTFCCVDTPTREFAKFGLLYLRNGQWDGRQIISESWVKDSTRKTGLNPAYAYQWWPFSDPKGPIPIDAFAARGIDDQRIYVIPSLDLVVARNGTYNKNPGPPIASMGYLWSFGPRTQELANPLSLFGTKNAKMWLDEPFLSPIINSIICNPNKIDTTKFPDLLDIKDDPPLCKERMMALGGNPPYCEALHGCVCDHCSSVLLACDADEGCKDILRCGLEAKCRGIDCYEICEKQINAHGGAFSSSTNIALLASDCSKPCPLGC